MPVYLIIFGAAVGPDGKPSGSLSRRIQGALRTSEGHPDCLFLATGGRGKHGPAEGEVIAAELISQGIPQSRILIESRARDTLESVLYCHEILRGYPNGLIIACSSNYHNPRCATLLRLLGHHVHVERMPPDLPYLGWRKLITYLAKELIAFPYDALLMLAIRYRCHNKQGFSQ
jgi:uncharacterized SAM-binding protein YcdF (DUF218 family)